MHFHPKWDGLVRPDVSDSAAHGPRSARGVARLPLGERGHREAADVRRGPLAAERLARIRQRVRDGFYASPEMTAMLAARLLDSGDL